MTTGGEEAPQPAGPPAGWYPVDGGGQRYWDGSAWTEHTAPGPQPVPPAPAPAASAPTPLQPPAPGAVTSDDRTMALLIHLLTLVSGFIAPLIIWLIKRDQSPFIDHHGKEALNFQITLLIGWFAAMLLLLVLIGLVLMPVLLVAQILFPILAAVAANRGELYRYPLTIRFIS
jgi:uncharacterized Tic20 family protein